MKMDIVKNPNTKLAAIKAGQLALISYRSMLRTKIYATDMVIGSLAAMAANEKRIPQKQEIEKTEVIKKENTDMKHLLAGIAAVAAVGAALGAGYVYYKKNKAVQEDYEEIIFTDDMDGEFGEVVVEEDDKMEKVVRAAEDVKDVVVSAAENVADTVADAFYDIKEAIDSAIEE